MLCPEVTTERLRLRRHGEADLEACFAMWSSAEVTRYIGGRPFTREEVWARILRYVGHWEMKRYGFWLMEEKESGEFVGEVGFADHKRGIAAELDGLPEIGWVVSPARQVKGYASEAIAAVVAWVDEEVACEKTFCVVHSENAVSLHLARKHGYGGERQMEYKGHSTLVLTRGRVGR